MKRNVFIIVLLMCLPVFGWSQYKFEETLSISYDDYLYSQDIDSGNFQYIATGYESMYERFNKDILLVKWNDQPGYLWAKRYAAPGSWTDIGRHVMKTQDNGYLVSGFTNSYNSGSNYDGFTMKTNSYGEVIWFVYYGGSFNDYSYSSCEDTNYYYVAGKYGRSSTSNFTNGFIYCFNKSTGAVVWGKRYKSYSDAYYFSFNSIIVGYDGNLVVTGTCLNSTQSFMMCAKINPATGNLIWNYFYRAYSTKLTSVNIAKGHNNGYILTGNYGKSKVMLLKLKSNGSVSWAKTYFRNGIGDVGIQTIKTTNGYATYGVTKSFGSDDLFLLNTDTAGRRNWMHIYHGPGSTEGTLSLNDLGTSLLYLADDGYAMVSGKKNSANTWDSYLLRADSYGHTGCELDTSFIDSTLSVYRYTLSDSLFNISAIDTAITAYTLSPSWDTICGPDSLITKTKALERIPKNETALEVHVYPNPASKTLFLDFETPLESIAEIQIFNYTGQLKMHKTINTTTSKLVSLDIGQIAPGLYIVQVLCAKSKTTIKIIIE
jgi:hypothetical protein